MKITKISAAVAATFLLLSTTGCDKFLDVNTDPINPTSVPITLLMPTTQASMSLYLGHSVGGLGQPTSALVQQIVNFRVGAFSLGGNDFNNQWLGLYTSALENNEQMLMQGTEQNAWTFVGIAQIQKAYIFSQMVDVWGDIPYSEALKGVQFPAPKFDDDEAIYNDLFGLIDQGVANLRRTDSSRNPSATEDLIYGGDKAKWIRLANTLKLKLYNQIRLTRDVSSNVRPLIDAPADQIGGAAAAGAATNVADDFEFKYGTSAGNPENRHPGFQGDYAASSRENNINPYFYNLLKGNNDPRIPYYFFNQYASTTPLTTADYQDGRFVTVRFGSIGPQASANTTNTRTLQGLYPIGGRYDNGAGGTATGASGRGVVAQRFITFFARKFIEAELQLTVLNNPAAARTAFSDAVTASFTKVNAVAAAEPSTAGVPAIPAASITAYVTAALARYDAASNNEAKLAVIMTEKYIANYGTGVDVYTDYRRTGYPAVPFADTDNDSQTTQTGAFPVRLPYRQNDLLTNINAPKVQPNITTEKIFWDR
ncbi:SusD/RagB family nutrient-binding outer membrane lipoprotein [Hymenobacter sp. 15J16-1T3B]|uniref:SusD/RagB family nutrient-binding outer membrane lipoprotein n=1 Tax=Hymenobacter sp. 15J16-1T3B TaxID=2886941 RepID=UPI001D0F6CAC|nr:SusD/RagB family nutrient-binding outer membrane lipoprotein [Hymenobacter sp. 15J16-1T3B]MCC3157290.1 SusD/RagB family nutrient-binding outer membrane lipoprotein [Hymenobacter sp. 15J16-1T3B]